MARWDSAACPGEEKKSGPFVRPCTGLSALTTTGREAPSEPEGGHMTGPLCYGCPFRVRRCNAAASCVHMNNVQLGLTESDSAHTNVWLGSRHCRHRTLGEDRCDFWHVQTRTETSSETTIQSITRNEDGLIMRRLAIGDPNRIQSAQRLWR